MLLHVSDIHFLAWQWDSGPFEAATTVASTQRWTNGVQPNERTDPLSRVIRRPRPTDRFHARAKEPTQQNSRRGRLLASCSALIDHAATGLAPVTAAPAVVAVPVLPGSTQFDITGLTGVVAGVLNPWPSNVLPTPICVAPVANAGGPYTVVSGGTVNIAATSTGTSPTYAWAAPTPGGTLSNSAIATPVFTAPTLPAAQINATTVTLSVTATNACGNSTATQTVSVTPFLAPTVNAVTPLTVTPNTTGTILLTGVDSNVAAKTTLTFAVTQSGTIALTTLTVTQTVAGATVSFKTPATTGVITLNVMATNSVGKVSAVRTTTITVSSTGIAPIANAGGPYTVNSGSKIVLAGNATGTPTLTYQWSTVPAGQGSFSVLTNSGTPTYQAPAVTVNTIVTLQLQVTNATGSSTVTTTATVLPLVVPTVNPVAPISVFSGAQNGSFTVSATDLNIPASTPLSFQITQTGSPALTNIAIGGGTTTSKVVTFRAPTLPTTQVTPSVITLTIRAINNAGKVSAPITTTVSIFPFPDTVTITNADYRTGQQRLVVTATSNIVNANLVLTLQPYVTTLGTIFDPATLGNTFTNGGGGLYTLTLVGAPEPAIPPATPLVVRSSINGVSPAHGLDVIRL